MDSITEESSAEESTTKDSTTEEFIAEESTADESTTEEFTTEPNISSGLLDSQVSAPLPAPGVPGSLSVRMPHCSRPGLLVWGVVAGVCTAASGVMVILLFPSLLRTIVSSKLQLSPDSEISQSWIDPPVKPLLRVYYFNVTNPAGYLSGEVPVLEEVGPYTYQQRWTREGVVWSEDGRTIRSRMKKTYFLRPDLTKGSLEDELVLPNVPMFGMLSKMRATGPEQLLAANYFLGTQGQEVFERHTVLEATWGFQHPLVDMANQVLPPDQKLPDQFGFFYGKNGSLAKEMETQTGSAGIGSLGQIVRMDNQSSLTAWEGEECNAIRGTDGSMFPPFLSDTSVLHLFSPDLCRSLALTYTGERVPHQGLETMRFAPSKEMFGEGDFSCFDSAPHGMFNVSACQGGAPMLLSWPHFYGGDPALLDQVSGLSPRRADHQLQVDLVPGLGVGLRAAIRIQINLHIQTEGVTLLENATDVFLPIIWFSDGIDELDDPDTVSLLRAAVEQPETIRTALYVVLVTVGVSLALACAVILIKNRRSETSPELTGTRNLGAEPGDSL